MVSVDNFCIVWETYFSNRRCHIFKIGTYRPCVDTIVAFFIFPIIKKLVFDTDTDSEFAYKTVDLVLGNCYELSIIDAYKDKKKKFLSTGHDDSSLPSTSNDEMSPTSKSTLSYDTEKSQIYRRKWRFLNFSSGDRRSKPLMNCILILCSNSLWTLSCRDQRRSALSVGQKV